MASGICLTLIISPGECKMNRIEASVLVDSIRRAFESPLQGSSSLSLFGLSCRSLKFWVMSSCTSGTITAHPLAVSAKTTSTQTREQYVQKRFQLCQASHTKESSKAPISRGHTLPRGVTKESSKAPTPRGHTGPRGVTKESS